MKRSLALFLMVPISQICTLMSFYYYAKFVYNQMPIIPLLLSMAICVIADSGLFFIRKHMRRNDLLQQKINRIESELGIHKKHYDVLSDSIAQQKKISHDYINQIQAIYTLLNDNCVEEAKVILENQQELILQSKRISYCKNRIVDAVVINKINLAESAHITITVAIDLSEETPFQNIDLCNLFGNILDNAIASCRDINGECCGRTISLTCGEKGNYIIVKCRNTKENAVSFTDKRRVQTSKSNADNHGYGLMIIEEIAVKYHGRCAISYDDDYFQIIVYLQLAPEPAEIPANKKTNI